MVGSLILQRSMGSYLAGTEEEAWGEGCHEMFSQMLIVIMQSIFSLNGIQQVPWVRTENIFPINICERIGYFPQKQPREK